MPIVGNIIVDTREAKPYNFELKPPSGFAVGELIEQGLKAGDYTLEGYSDPSAGPSIIIERKGSFEEFLGNIGKHWERFQRELEKLEPFTIKKIVIEDDLKTAYGRYKKTKFFNFPPSYILKRISEIEMIYGVTTIFVTNRTYGQQYVLNLFKQFLITHGE